MWSAVAMTLAPGDLFTSTTMAGRPLDRPRFCRFSGPSTTWAMSRMRTGAPLR